MPLSSDSSFGVGGLVQSGVKAVPGVFGVVSAILLVKLLNAFHTGILVFNVLCSVGHVDRAFHIQYSQ